MAQHQPKKRHGSTRVPAHAFHLRYVAHSCVHFLYYTTATGNSIRYWNNGSLSHNLTISPSHEHLTNHLIMRLLRETRTPSLDTSCKEGMAWCSSIPMQSLWSVYCVLCGSVALTRTHWPMYRACIHKANLQKKNFETNLYSRLFTDILTVVFKC